MHRSHAIDDPQDASFDGIRHRRHPRPADPPRRAGQLGPTDCGPSDQITLDKVFLALWGDIDKGMIRSLSINDRRVLDQLDLEEQTFLDQLSERSIKTLYARPGSPV